MSERLRSLALGLWPRALTLLAGLGAGIPVIVATVHAIEVGWVPLADRGIIATRAHDVFSSHMPLVGQYTLAGGVTGRIVHSLGPMLFWLLSIPAHLGSTAGMTATIGAINTLSILGCVALARRRGGAVLMFMTAIAIALMCQSLAAETFHDVWNNSAALFPLMLLVFLCWSLACGEYRLLVPTVLVASFAAQTHLSFLPPAALLVAIGVAGLLARTISGNRLRPSAAAVRLPEAIRGRSLLIWTLLALLVAALCWSAPIDEELSEAHGNLGLVIETATASKQTLGARAGWYAVVRAVGITPWWLQRPHSRWQRKYEVRSAPGPLSRWSCAGILCALLAMALVGLYRRRAELVSLALISFALCFALAGVAAETPTPPLLSATLGYTMWWGSPMGMFVWLALAWGLWLGLAALIGPLRSRLPASTPRPRARAAAALLAPLTCLGAIAAVAGSVAAAEGADEHVAIYRPVRVLAARLKGLVPSGETILLEGELNIATMPVKPAIRYLLVARNVRVLAPGSYLRLGNWYELYHRRYEAAVYLSDVDRSPHRGARLVGKASWHDGFGENSVYEWFSNVPGR